MAKYTNVSSRKQLFYKADGEKITVQPGEVIDSDKLGFEPPAAEFEKEGLMSRIFSRKKEATRGMPMVTSITGVNKSETEEMEREMQQIMQNASPSVRAAMQYMIEHGGNLPEAIHDRNNPMGVNRVDTMPHVPTPRQDRELSTGEQLPPLGAGETVLSINAHDPAEDLLEPIIAMVSKPPVLKPEPVKETVKPKRYKRSE